jgi:hypothetical protein
MTMKDLIKDAPETDEFTPIELGSVSEETRGVQPEGDEYFIGSLNSQA